MLVLKIKAVADSFRQIGENLNTGAQSSVVMPLMYDPETKQPVFKMDLLESKGGKAYDVPISVNNYKMILQQLCHVRSYVLTGNSPDNYSIGTGRTNLMALHLNLPFKRNY